MFDDLGLEYVEFYVEDLDAAADHMVHRFGFAMCGISGWSRGCGDHYSKALRQGDIVAVLTQGHSNDHPATSYARLHGDTVANIAFRTLDVRATFAAAVDRGARVVAEPAEVPHGGVVATIGGFGDVHHTLVERREVGSVLPPGMIPVAGSARGWPQQLRCIDHFAVCLGTKEMDETANFYRDVLDFQVVFDERIAVGTQAILTKAVQCASGSITLTLVAPDPDSTPGQIDDFLRNNVGPGVQHMAFAVQDIVAAVGSLRARGVSFLDTPEPYYALLAQRFTPTRHTIDELRANDILLDQDQDGQLLQIFAQSTHPRQTFFFEVIERLGGRSFGTGNIQALYEAVELERSGQRR